MKGVKADERHHFPVPSVAGWEAGAERRHGCWLRGSNAPQGRLEKAPPRPVKASPASGLPSHAGHGHGPGVSNVEGVAVPRGAVTGAPLGGNHGGDDLVAVEQEADRRLIAPVGVFHAHNRAVAELDIHGVHEDLVGLRLGDQEHRCILADVGSSRALRRTR